jgi:tetratricopeptide (TPR) repeat protein
MDYLVYSYLQKGDNKLAKAQWDYLKTIKEVNPLNFKVAYAYASIPSRYLLENKKWSEAANLELHPANFPWEKFPWQKAIVHFTRILGFANIKDVWSAKMELNRLSTVHDTLIKRGELYQASQVQNQLKTSEAWIAFKEGRNNEAISLMKLAADMEDKTEKHPVTPGEVLPARELLGEMFMQMNKPSEALIAYETNLTKHPNRFNGLYGAALAAEKSNNPSKSVEYYQKLTNIAITKDSDRPELTNAMQILSKSQR